MKQFRWILAVGFICLIAPAFAQSQVLPAGSFDKFFAEFKAAVARNDVKSVTELTQLRFLFDSKPRDSAGFQKNFPELFDAKVRACFAKAKAVIEQDAHVV